MARRKKHSRGRKFSAWKTAKGLAYGGALALPAYSLYKTYGGGAVGAEKVVRHACFLSTEDNSIRLDNGLLFWGPVAVLGLVDWGTSKLGLQRQISRGINGVLG